MHIPTLFLINVTLSLVVSLTLALTTHKRYSELYFWSASLALIGIGYGSVALRGQVSDLWSIITGNTLFAVSAALLAEGVYRFQRRTPNRWWLWAPVPVTLLCFSLFLNDMGMRLLLGALLVCIQLVFVLTPLIRQHRSTVGRGQYATMAGVFIAIVCMLARSYDVLNGHVPESLFDTNPLYSLIFYGNLLGLMLITFGMVQMVQERTIKELEESESQYRQLIDSAQEGVCILGKEHCIFANPRLAELLNVSAQDLVNQPFLPYIYADDRHMALTHHTHRLGGMQNQPAYDIRLLPRHGQPRWFRISGLTIQWRGELATLIFLSDIHERKQTEEKANQLAYQDALTRLPNRRMLSLRLESLLGTQSEHTKHNALIFIDLDHFKELNDTHGHQTGDILLIQVSERLRQQTRDTDTVTRLGGDEFVILMPGLHEDYHRACEQAQRIGEKILEALKQPYLLESNHADEVKPLSYHCSASIGIHVFGKTHMTEAELLEHADKAMYEAKRHQKGSIRISNNPFLPIPV